MSEFKGTKGILKIRLAQPAENANIKIKTDKILCIGVDRKNGFEDTFELVALVGSNGSEEAQANILLFSKAPEMLKELKNIVKCWDKNVFQELDIDAVKQLIKEATEIDDPLNGSSITSTIH